MVKKYLPKNSALKTIDAPCLIIYHTHEKGPYISIYDGGDEKSRATGFDIDSWGKIPSKVIDKIFCELEKSYDKQILSADLAGKIIMKHLKCL